MDNNPELEKIIKSEYSNTSGVVVYKNGTKQYEKYFNNCNTDSKIHVYSVSKSIISLLIGIAIDKGYIKSLNQKILDLFPDYKVPRNNPTIENITLRDLMTMTAPYKYKDSFFTYIKYFRSKDNVQFTLNKLGGKGSIGDFRYTPLIGPDILTGILSQVTGQSVIDFASKYLFEPLDIKVPKEIIFKSAKEQFAFNEATDINGWVMDSKGINTGGWGLTLTANDMAKIGLLYMNEGTWNNEEIVSSSWIHETLKMHSIWKEENLSYGYLWWIIDENKKIYAAMGDGGNIIYINKEKDLVVAINCLFVKNAKDRIMLIQKYIEPFI